MTWYCSGKGLGFRSLVSPLPYFCHREIRIPQAQTTDWAHNSPSTQLPVPTSKGILDPKCLVHTSAVLLAPSTSWQALFRPTTPGPHSHSTANSNEHISVQKQKQYKSKMVLHLWKITNFIIMDPNEMTWKNFQTKNPKELSSNNSKKTETKRGMECKMSIQNMRIGFSEEIELVRKAKLKWGWKWKVQCTPYQQSVWAEDGVKESLYSGNMRINF